MVTEDMWWLEELELKQALQFCFGLGLCNIVDTSFRSNAQGQRTHSARTNISLSAGPYMACRGDKVGQNDDMCEER